MPKYISKLQSQGIENSLNENFCIQDAIGRYKSSEIAALLSLDEKTISTYKLRLLQKTGSKTIIGLYLFNVKHNSLTR
jgi:hypothetical protein